MSSGQNVGNVFLTLKATGMSAFQKQVKNEGNKAAGVMTKTFSSAFSKIGAITAAALSTRAIKSFVKESIDIASDLAEVQNVVDVTFGNSAKIINDFAESAPKAYGLSTLAAKQYSGTIGAMLKSMRIAQKDVLGMSTSIASLAGDMASFYNLDTDTAFEKIRAGISGETEPLKQLGINLSVANLEQYRMNKGITTAYNKMSQADQAILRYNYLLEVTADAQGDFARTSDSWANQTRILALNIDTLKASVGNLAIQALTPLIIKLNQIIEYAIAAAQALTQLFGGKVDTSSAGAGMSAVSASAVQAAGDMTDTAKTAKKTAKAIKASFADFDEIHLLGNPKDDSSAGADTAGAAGGQALSPLSVTNKTNTQSLDNNFDKKKLSNIGKLSGLALVGMGVIFILTGHLPLGLAMVAAGTSISAASINWGTLEHNISSTISIISAVVGGAMLAVGAVLCFSGAYMPLGIGLMASGAASLGSAAALNWSGLSDQMRDRISVISAIVGGSLLALGAILCFSSVNIPLGIALMAGGALTYATTASLNWNGMSQKVQDTLSIVGAILSGSLLAVGAILTLTMISPVLGISLMAAGAAGLVAVTALNWNNMGEKTKKALNVITAIVGGALLAVGATLCFSGAMLPLGISMIAAGAASLVTNSALDWKVMETKTGKTVQAITAIAGGALLALGVILCFTGAALPLGIGLIIAGAGGLAASVKIDWDALFKKIKGVWSKITSWFQTSVKPVFTVQYWKNKFSVIGDALKNIINTKILNHLNNMINKINSFLTISVGPTAAKVLNKLGANVSGGTFRLFSVPQVPYLEQGGYLTKNNPTLAVVGDNKREGEIVSPESKIREQVELALSKVRGNTESVDLAGIIKQAIREALYELQFIFGGDWHIVIVDERGTVKAEHIISAAERKNRRDGRTVIALG